MWIFLKKLIFKIFINFSYFKKNSQYKMLELQKWEKNFLMNLQMEGFMIGQ